MRAQSSSVKSYAAIAAFTVLLIAACILLVGTPGGGREKIATQPPATTGEELKRGNKLANAPVPAAAKAVVRKQRKLERERKSPAAEAARRNSRTAHRDLDAKAALAAVKEHASVAIETPAWSAPALREGEEITGFRNEHIARVEMPGEKTDALVEAIGEPLAVRTPEGGLKGVDVTLRPDGAGFVPARASVRTLLPTDIGDDVYFGEPAEDQIRVKLSGASSRAQLVREENKLFYANTQKDTDTILEPTPSGAAISWTLRSPEAPARLEFEFDGPAKNLALLEDGSIRLDGGPLGNGFVTAPVAFDAAGTPVPSRYELDGEKVQVVTEHAGKDVLYPLTIDPAVTFNSVPAFSDDMGPDGANVVRAQTNYYSSVPFPFSSSNPTNFQYSSTLEGSGARMKIQMRHGTGTSGWGNLTYDAPNNATIFRADFINVSHNNVDRTTARAGILSPGSTWESATVGLTNPQLCPTGCWWAADHANSTTVLSSSTVHLCAASDCGMGGSINNKLVLQFAFDRPAGTPANTSSSNVQTRGAYIYFSDYDPPSLSLPSFGPKWKNRSADALAATVNDNGGVGLGEWKLVDSLDRTRAAKSAFNVLVDGQPVLPLIPVTGQEGKGIGPACTGNFQVPCPTVYSPSIAGFWNGRDGLRNYSFEASDIVGRSPIPQNHQLGTDNEGPEVELSGRLGAMAREATSNGPRTIVGDTPFIIHARDGLQKKADGQPASGSQRRSGVQSLKAEVYRANPDGSESTQKVNELDFGTKTTPGASNSDCNPNEAGEQDSCPMSHDGNFAADSSGLDPGIYYFNVTATDWANNTTVKKFKLAVGVAEITTISEGQATSRYLPVEVKRTRGSATAYRLQFRTGPNKQWRDVQACSDADKSAVRKEADGSSVASWPQSFTDGVGERLVVDVHKLKDKQNACPGANEEGVDGTVYVRAVVEGSTHESTRSSEDVLIEYDPTGLATQNDTMEMGPGTVDLATGNLQVSATDVSIDAFKGALSVTRTYNSKKVDVTDVLGPGWEIGIPTEGAGAEYVSVTDDADPSIPEDERWPSVTVETVDGGIFTFELSSEQDKYIPEVGLESLKLERIKAANDPLLTKGFKLTDLETGTVVTFDSKSANTPAGQYDVTDVSAPGIDDQVTFAYQFDSSGKSRVEYAFAPTGGLTCRPSGKTAAETWTDMTGAAQSLRGCQALKFEYMDHAAGKRLQKIWLKTFDPDFEGGKFRTIQVAEYAFDASGRLKEAWDPRVTPNPLKSTYTYAASGKPLLTSVKPAGEEPMTMSYTLLPEDERKQSSKNKYGRLSKVERSALSAGTAVQSITYGVPTTTAQSSNAPYNMSTAEVAKWGQAVAPWTATAVFAPDQPANGENPTNFGVAAISYLDPMGREVNSASPGGRISVAEYNKYGEVTRTLSAENRKRAMDAPGDAEAKLAAAQKWDTENTYEFVAGSPSMRRHLKETLEPEHQVRLKDTGQLVNARKHTVITYSDAAEKDPDTGEPWDLPVKQVVSARVGSSDYDERTTETAYTEPGATGSEKTAQMKLGLPRLVTADPGAGKLNIKRRTKYNAEGLEVERFQPRSQGSNEPSTTKTIYYAAGTHPDDSACSDRPEWLGLVCKVAPGAQPGGSLPNLPEKTITYNHLRQPLTATEVVVDGGTKTRTATNTYDAAGRIVTEALASDLGEAIKPKKHIYHATTGREIETQSLNPDGSMHQKVSRSFDTLGRQISYIDAGGKISTTTYDILSRPTGESDERSIRTYAYDPVTGDTIGLLDSGLAPAGAFGASYDHDGRLIAEAMPAGLAKSIELDSVGNATTLTYTRTVDCSTNCNWLVNTAEYNIHGQMVAQGGLPTKVGANTSQKFDYDAVGRLAEVEDKSAGQCTIRRYEFDADSNRTAKKTYAPDGNGDCDPTSTPATKSNSFDDADRITNSGYQYDAFGRTATTPEEDAGGSGDLHATYYANDLARSITQDGKTQTLTLDPMQRMSSKVKSGGWSGSETYHYSDDSDSPAWIQDGSSWTRWVAGIGGDVAATQNSGGYLGWTISNIRGDMIAEAGGGGIFNAREVDEFGVVKDGLPSSRPYGFHGSKTRQTLTEGGVIAMGVRLYSPNTGRFLQTDPVLGGTENPYEYPSDPVNEADLDGRSVRCRLLPYCGSSSLFKKRLSRSARSYAKASPRYGRWVVDTVCIARGWRALFRKGNKILALVCVAWGTRRYYKTYY